jgi:hypothetical protein
MKSAALNLIPPGDRRRHAQQNEVFPSEKVKCLAVGRLRCHSRSVRPSRPHEPAALDLSFAAKNFVTHDGAKKGGGARVRTSPVAAHASAVRAPRNEMSKGAADRWGMAAAFPPDALPLRAVAATRRRPPQRPYERPRSHVGRKLSVRKRTCTVHAC